MATVKSNQGKKRSQRVTKRRNIKDRLGFMTVYQAEQWLGDEGPKKLIEGAKLEVNPSEDIQMSGDSLFCNVQDGNVPGGIARVTLVEKTSKRDGVQLHCDQCDTVCIHIAATLHEILESKVVLGMAEVPDPTVPLEHLTPKELIIRAIEERRLRSTSERMQIRSADSSKPWVDYNVTSQESGRSYRVSLRGQAIGESYCSCPDFKTNLLGVCKHIFRVKTHVEKKFSQKQLDIPYVRKNLSLRMHYGTPEEPHQGLKWNLPHNPPADLTKLLGKDRESVLTDVAAIMKTIQRTEGAGYEVHVYPDAETYINSRLLQAKIRKSTDDIRKDMANHPLRRSLLKVELLPYQLDGIAFSVGNGRAILADDMGLGKTIQGIGTAELFARLAGIKNVLVVCPASLKRQWASEVERFSDRSCNIVLGSASDRAKQYRDASFFKIANYEQVLRDEAIVQSIHWDLIILDEGQRIKNWESKTSQTFQSLKSTYALILSGTPLENRLDELFTVAKFIDCHRLGPAYQFFNQYRTVNEDGRVVGYKNLEQLRESLRPILLRRTRASVMQQLPERTTEIVRIRPTDEQKTINDEHLKKASMIAGKAYLTELDLLRLQKHLLAARMACNSTYLVNKETPSYSSKLDVLDELLAELADEESRKIVLFSEWTTMLDLIEPLLKKHGIDFVRLDGRVPQKKRQEIVHRFQKDKDCRAIIMSNAGSTGLNLQAANTVVNIDLPWNPAVLEQRIARAHRMGQKRPVHVYVLVTEETIEEKLLETLAAKSELSSAVLDFDSELDEVAMKSGIEELKRRLEVLLGEKSVARVDQSMQREVDSQIAGETHRRERVAAAGGELLGAALNLVSQLLDQGNEPEPQMVEQMATSLASCTERDEHGRPQLKLTLPNDESLKSLAKTLAQLLVAKSTLLVAK
jgi:superfamily II DNA or RNA helicase